MKSLSRMAILAAICALAACARSPEIPFEHSAQGPVKTIGIITPGFPAEPDVVLATSIGQSFGLIGALVDAGLKDNRDTKFQAALSQQHFSAPAAFLDKLQAGLEAEGYKIIRVSATRESKKFVENYTGLAQPGIDAYLDIYTPSFGYISAGIGSSTPYRPLLYTEARLVRATDKAILMSDRVRYNPLQTEDKAITIAPDPAYDFTDFDTLIGRPDRAVAGLKLALEQSAQTISTLLK